MGVLKALRQQRLASPVETQLKNTKQSMEVQEAAIDKAPEMDVDADDTKVPAVEEIPEKGKEEAEKTTVSPKGLPFFLISFSLP